MDHIVECPHCHLFVVINEQDISCKIFRHGIYKDGSPLNPHSSKEECDKAFNENLIWGCGKPFYFDKETLEVCDYI